MVWKPAETTPLTAVATTKIVANVLAECGAPPGVVSLLTGGAEVGATLAADSSFPLVSFTGSCAAGKQVSVNKILAAETYFDENIRITQTSYIIK